jgi:hypothetical protein
MHQEAPYPVALGKWCEQVRYRPGWYAVLHDDFPRDQVGGRSPGSDPEIVGHGMTLKIYADVQDSYHPNLKRPVNHLFIVPAATYDDREWLRWLLDRFIDVESHEACEWFALADGTRPYAPHHGPGRNPYVIHELGTPEEAETSFLGVLKITEEEA